MFTDFITLSDVVNLRATLLLTHSTQGCHYYYLINIPLQLDDIYIHQCQENGLIFSDDH